MKLVSYRRFPHTQVPPIDSREDLPDVHFGYVNPYKCPDVILSPRSAVQFVAPNR